MRPLTLTLTPNPSSTSLLYSPTTTPLLHYSTTPPTTPFYFPLLFACFRPIFFSFPHLDCVLVPRLSVINRLLRHHHRRHHRRLRLRHRPSRACVDFSVPSSLCWGVLIKIVTLSALKKNSRKEMKRRLKV